MSILESSMAFYDQPVEVPLQSMDQSSHSPTQIQRKELDSLLDMGAGGEGRQGHIVEEHVRWEVLSSL